MLILGIVWKCGFRYCSIHFHIQLNMYGLFTVVVWKVLTSVRLYPEALVNIKRMKNTVMYNSSSL